MSVRAVIAVAAVGLVCTFATLLLPSEVTAENARAAEFGYPVAYLTADTALTPPPGWSGLVSYDPNEYPADFHWARFCLAWAVVTSLLAGLLLLIAGARRRVRGRPPRPHARPS
jgi:hypothetical protein